MALVVFLVVAAVVSGFVALASRRAAEGARARAESEALVRPCRLVEHHDVARDASTRARASTASCCSTALPSGWEAEASAGDPVEDGSRAGAVESRSTTSTCSFSRGSSRPTTTSGFSTRSSPRSRPRSRSRSSRPRSGRSAPLVAARDARAALLGSIGRGLQDTATRIRVEVAADGAGRGRGRRPSERRPAPVARDGSRRPRPNRERRARRPRGGRLASPMCSRRLSARQRVSSRQGSRSTWRRACRSFEPTLPCCGARSSRLCRGHRRVAGRRAREDRRGRGLAGSRRADHRSAGRAGADARGVTGRRGVRRSGLRARDGWARRGRRDTRWRYDARFAFAERGSHGARLPVL